MGDSRGLRSPPRAARACLLARPHQPPRDPTGHGRAGEDRDRPRDPARWLGCRVGTDPSSPGFGAKPMTKQEIDGAKIVADVFAGLKGFQRKTADHVFRRMYDDPDPATRFLVADEVGLGKTLVARGLIAKTIQRLQEQHVKRIDVIYICSNAEIARQNIQRLNVTGQSDFSLASRITLLPLQLHRLNENGLNFVSFTPGTSFSMSSRGGTSQERAVLFHLLKKASGG